MGVTGTCKKFLPIRVNYRQGKRGWHYMACALNLKKVHDEILFKKDDS